MTDRRAWLPQIAAAKQQGYIPVIAEIKASSPAEGDLIGNRSIADIVAAYEAGGAACISVVTGQWFGGHIDMLSETAATTSLPVLRKDLIVNLDQIKQSQDYGANAVLLTRKILRPSHLAKMIELCLNLGITPFIEVASQDEMADITSDNRIIVAIANRDIGRKELDINSGYKSLNLIDHLHANVGARISASGISSAEDASKLIQAGFDGLLIGTSILKAANPAQAVREITSIHQ
ncbi:indole-3-glycerol phosphate synthase TrpC [Maricurvus nonylphenolicus]|uniref:indole-3-glycerol-phosphate synthase n=1 Tax=Maricurvus nonylphenolicus TaxID=1008307 RepID=UPI0036F20236